VTQQVTLVSIAVTPSAPSIALGINENFTATGTYSDSSTQVLTSQVTWTSGTTTVATISNAAGSSGVAHPVATGTTQITAALGSVISTAVTLTITPATLVSIAVTPTSPSIAATTTQQFAATGTYSNQSAHPVTSTVTWVSSNTSAATISNAGGSWGLATGLSIGSSSISATLGSITSPSVTLTVTAAPRVPTIVYSFAGGTADGAHPYAPLIQASNGSFYGTTLGGGAYSAGTAFNVTSAGVETVLHSFGATGDGLGPEGGLILANDGNLYGTLNAGGSPPYGKVFKMTTAGVETVLYSFNGSSGAAPSYMTLVQDSVGNLYGTTNGGGANSGSGTVFKITTAGVETVLHSFGAGTDGANPQAGLILGADGNLYGTTQLGGANGAGTVFEVTLPGGVESVLYSFGTGTDGSRPQGGVIQGTDGNFYGTTAFGGVAGNGAVFKVTPAGVETILHSFSVTGDGIRPYAGLTLGTDGNFYGTTYAGGTHGAGTLFSITPAGVETVLYSFGSTSGDGADPEAALIQGTDGHFYGTTISGGANGNGAVFKY
jgi:uncharacterized repeat protein (TIGR03803 family)